MLEIHYLEIACRKNYKSLLQTASDLKYNIIIQRETKGGTYIKRGRGWKWFAIENKREINEGLHILGMLSIITV